ncbi:non-hydrolyzing UDP-N-acetylglucosamine 2-epimerase [Elusimicrobiota bacterium]
MNKKKSYKVGLVFGTRPEAIKMAPVVRSLQARKCLEPVTIVTAQHRNMLDQVLDVFGIIPQYDMNIMQHRQPLDQIVAKTVTGLTGILERENPDIVLVHGDTTTTLASSLAASYYSIAVGHVEAGLRSHDVNNPFPEEYNRKVTDVLSRIHFAPTYGNRLNLLNEGYSDSTIHVTGNTVIDALSHVSDTVKEPEKRICRNLELTRRILLVTAHRRENFGSPIVNICKALKKISRDFPDVQIVYPAHLNPAIKITVKDILKGIKNIFVIPPVSYPDMVWLMKNANLCLTDSGGLQEEVPTFGVPVLVLRKVTERPEAVKAGTVKIIGTDRKRIYDETARLLSDRRYYNRFSKAVNPYGDGKAAERIADYLEYCFNIKQRKPKQWKI